MPKENAKMPKEIDYLLRVKMEPDASLKAYNTKYWETFNEILDCPPTLQSLSISAVFQLDID